ncbi:MAG: oxygen-independent coproporphyrinogen III oxidase [Pseudomonadota bacterium]
MTQDTLLTDHGLFTARAPRYTSYPTAPHFSKTVDGAQVATWLSSIPDGAQISLYVHIPFCRRLCRFCACRTQGTQTDAPLRPYLDRLKREVAMVAAKIGGPVSLSRLHWGGGTPTILPAEMIRELAETIFAHFPLAAGGEFSVEIDPTMIDAERLDALAAGGMTRVSLGVQDFAPKVQEAIGRPQTREQTRDTIDGLRARGITGVNLDLLYGLPFQTGITLTETLQAALALNPDRLALYGYAHVPWVARRQVTIPSDALPDGRARLDLFRIAARLLAADGYVPIGIDHFAQPGDGLAQAAKAGALRRNFQGYTDDQADVLIGLGASSISRFPQGYAQNDAGTSGWGRMVDAGDLPITRGHSFSDDDRLRAALIERILCDFRVNGRDVAAALGQDPAPAQALLSALAQRWPDVLIGGATKRLVVPELARLVAQDLDAYAQDGARHSMAL